MKAAVELKARLIEARGSATRWLRPGSANATSVENGTLSEALFDYRSIIRNGIVLLLVSIGGFVTWLSLAPLTSASIAPGIVKVAGERQSVQHFEGGIIREILVSEGDKVSANQVLIRLDPTQRKAARELLEGRLVGFEANAARLRAERDGDETLVFPADLEERARALADQDLLTGELRVFESRLEALAGQRRIMRQRIERFRDEIKAYEAQRRSSEEQLGYIHEELEAATTIYQQGLYEKPRYLALKRQVSQLEGSIGELDALVARTRQRIGETELEIIDLENQWTSRAAAELQTVNGAVLDVREQLGAADDVLNRLAITAPQAGIVVGLKFHTVGGVVRAGEHVLDIVPSDAVLVVEARVRPEDIDVVAPGLICDVQLSAYSYRSTPALPGKVNHVSADIFVDNVSNVSYYRALVEVDLEALQALEGVELYPGMQAEVFIRTGRRSAILYLTEPLTRSLRRAFRE